jgi:hypothetical protein
MIMRYIRANLALALALCLHLLAIAKPVKARDITDVIGGACVPDSATVRAGLYQTAGFGVRFGSGTGRIRLLCPYHLHSDTRGKQIGITMMSFIDQDGMEVGTRVRAILRRAQLGSNVAITIGTCDSNTSSITGPSNRACFMPAYTTQINESYWWEILIDRSVPNLNVEFLMVGMRYYSSAAAAAAEAAATPKATVPARPSGVLTTEQCNSVWKTTPGAPARSDDPENFAEATDSARIDANADGTIDRSEFVAACGKGLVRAPARRGR